MEREEWKSGMMVEDEHVLNFISEIDEAIDKAKETFKDYRPLLNGDRWICDREAAEFLKSAGIHCSRIGRKGCCHMYCSVARYSTANEIWRNFCNGTMCQHRSKLSS